LRFRFQGFGIGFEIGQRGRYRTCDPPVPSRVRWLPPALRSLCRVGRRLTLGDSFQRGGFDPLSQRERDRVRGEGTSVSPRREYHADSSQFERPNATLHFTLLSPSPRPCPCGRGRRLFRYARSHRMARFLPRWKAISLSSGERAGVRASVSSHRIVPAEMRKGWRSCAKVVVRKHLPARAI
jgi:hypothetical protein